MNDTPCASAAAANSRWLTAMRTRRDARVIIAPSTLKNAGTTKGFPCRIALPALSMVCVHLPSPGWASLQAPCRGSANATRRENPGLPPPPSRQPCGGAVAPHLERKSAAELILVLPLNGMGYSLIPLVADLFERSVRTQRGTRIVHFLGAARVFQVVRQLLKEIATSQQSQLRLAVPRDVAAPSV